MRTFTTITLLFVLLSGYAQNESISGETNDFYLDFSSLSAENNATVPEILWKNPAIQSSNFDARRYKLLLNIRSEKTLDDVSVYLNDYPIIKQRGFAVVSVKSLNDYERVVDTEILLRPGENTIRVTASNTEGGKATSFRKINVFVDELKKSAMDRKDMALLFATDQYDHWDNLQNPINDATTIAMDLKVSSSISVRMMLIR